ncbi:hypothetical protein AVEN_21158-1 [Araneus ventricosus]|uniref:ATP-dependent DNA helicase n=1 Tax=Araneus ventricosus TaxID=182803 RepID=A0A4Y2NZW5_ARAVE|nr:hypothetical protein AVEN_21158-1 [Araneus ventricosus]
MYIGRSHVELGVKQSQKLLQETKVCHIIIITEISKLSFSLFEKIDLRCRKVKPRKSDTPFGVMFLFLPGDIKQLPPVSDRPFYCTNFKGTLQDQGQILYKFINRCYELTTSYWKQGENQRIFRDLLDRLSVGKSTVEVWRLLMTREKANFLLKSLLHFMIVYDSTHKSIQF